MMITHMVALCQTIDVNNLIPSNALPNLLKYVLTVFFFYNRFEKNLVNAIYHLQYQGIHFHLDHRLLIRRIVQYRIPRLIITFHHQYRR